MLKKFSFVASICSLGIAPGVYAKDDVAAVSAAVEELRVLMITPDKAKLDALLADDLSYGHSGGKIDTKASCVADLLTGDAAFVSIANTDQTVKVVGNNGIVRHTMGIELRERGKDPHKMSMKILQVWKKQDGQWKLLARQAFRIP